MNKTYYVAGIPFSSELYHYGIKGQKWGKRRFTDENGILTALGRMRYGVGEALGSAGNTISRTASSAAKSVSSAYNKGKEYLTGSKARAKLDRLGTTHGYTYKPNRVSNSRYAKDISDYQDSKRRASTIGESIKRQGFDPNLYDDYNKHVKDANAYLNAAAKSERARNEESSHNAMARYRAQLQYDKTLPGQMKKTSEKVTDAVKNISDKASATAKNVSDKAKELTGYNHRYEPSAYEKMRIRDMISNSKLNTIIGEDYLVENKKIADAAREKAYNSSNKSLKKSYEEVANNFDNLAKAGALTAATNAKMRNEGYMHKALADYQEQRRYSKTLPGQIDALKNSASKAVRDIGTRAEQISADAKEAINESYNDVIDWLDDHADKVSDAASKAGSAIKSAADKKLSDAKSTASKGAKEVEGFFQNLFGKKK